MPTTASGRRNVWAKNFAELMTVIKDDGTRLALIPATSYEPGKDYPIGGGYGTPGGYLWFSVKDVKPEADGPWVEEKEPEPSGEVPLPQQPKMDRETARNLERIGAEEE